MENSRQAEKYFPNFGTFERTCGLDIKTGAVFKMVTAVWNSEQPAYQNLRQKVDNFVASHLSTQEWSPSINKNQVRNGLRQSVVQSGMLESGVDRIITQVVDPKLNHIFRPHIEKAIHEFLTSENKDEGVSNTETDQQDATSSNTPKAQ